MKGNMSARYAQDVLGSLGTSQLEFVTRTMVITPDADAWAI